MTEAVVESTKAVISVIKPTWSAMVKATRALLCSGLNASRMMQSFAKLAQQQAKMQYELVSLSGCSHEEIQHHISHSVHSLKSLLAIYRVYGKFPCELAGNDD